MKKEVPDIPSLFGQQVKAFRKKAGLTQEQLSERLGISQKHLSIIETGTQFASAQLIAKLCEELNVSPGALFGGTESDDIKNLRGTMLTLYNDMNNKMAAMFATLSQEIQNLKE